jgi:outer membrane murein-binding lipoprotein Lpp
MQYSLLFLSFLSVSHSLPLVSREALHDLAPRLVPRDAPQLLSQIRDLNTAVTSLTSAVNAFDGSLLGLLPQSLAVVATEAKVDALTLKATYTAEQSSNFTAAESTEIVQTLATQIGPIQDSLNAIKAKVSIATSVNINARANVV